jgi:8-oxo-dGTP diphosphatase
MFLCSVAKDDTPGDGPSRMRLYSKAAMHPYRGYTRPPHRWLPMRNGFIYPKLSVWAVIRRHGKLLVTVKRDATGLGFACPGGAQNHGETLSQAVRRECLEEIGCDVTVADVLFVREYLAKHHKAAALDGDLHLLAKSALLSVRSCQTDRNGMRCDYLYQGCLLNPTRCLSASESRLPYLRSSACWYRSRSIRLVPAARCAPPAGRRRS